MFILSLTPVRQYPPNAFFLMHRNPIAICAIPVVILKNVAIQRERCILMLLKLEVRGEKRPAEFMPRNDCIVQAVDTRRVNMDIFTLYPTEAWAHEVTYKVGWDEGSTELKVMQKCVENNEVSEPIFKKMNDFLERAMSSQVKKATKRLLEAGGPRCTDVTDMLTPFLDVNFPRGGSGRIDNREFRLHSKDGLWKGNFTMSGFPSPLSEVILHSLMITSIMTIVGVLLDVNDDDGFAVSSTATVLVPDAKYLCIVSVPSMTGEYASVKLRIWQRAVNLPFFLMDAAPGKALDLVAAIMQWNKDTVSGSRSKLKRLLQTFGRSKRDFCPEAYALVHRWLSTEGPSPQLLKALRGSRYTRLVVMLDIGGLRSDGAGVLYTPIGEFHVYEWSVQQGGEAFRQVVQHTGLLLLRIMFLKKYSSSRKTTNHGEYSFPGASVEWKAWWKSQVEDGPALNLEQLETWFRHSKKSKVERGAPSDKDAGDLKDWKAKASELLCDDKVVHVVFNSNFSGTIVRVNGNCQLNIDKAFHATMRYGILFTRARIFVHAYGLYIVGTQSTVYIYLSPQKKETPPVSMVNPHVYFPPVWGC
jgi:hypothetical protein